MSAREPAGLSGTGWRGEAVMAGLVAGRLPEPLLGRAPVLLAEPGLGAITVLECGVVLRPVPGLRGGAALRGEAALRPEPALRRGAALCAEPALRCGAALCAEAALGLESALRGEPVPRGHARLRSVPALGRGAGLPRRRESGLLRIPGRTGAGLLLGRVPALLVVASGGRVAAAGRAVPVGAVPVSAVPARRDRTRRQGRARLRDGAALRCGRWAESGLRAKAGRGSWVAARAGRALPLPREAGWRLPRVPRCAARVAAWSALTGEVLPGRVLTGEALPGLALALVARLRPVSPVEPGTYVLRAAGTRTLVAVRVGVGLHGWLRQGRAFDGGVVRRVALWIGSTRRRGGRQRTRPAAGQSGGLSWPSGRIRAGGIRRL